jgi:hypothetical protein
MRKPDPKRIYQARRSAIFHRLMDEQRLDELDAERWIAAWEREAEARALDRRTDAFWQDSARWITEQWRKQ